MHATQIVTEVGVFHLLHEWHVQLPQTADEQVCQSEPTAVLFTVLQWKAYEGGNPHVKTSWLKCDVGYSINSSSCFIPLCIIFIKDQTLFAVQLKDGLHAFQSIRPASLPRWGRSHAQTVGHILYQLLKLGSPCAISYYPAPASAAGLCKNPGACCACLCLHVITCTWFGHMWWMASSDDWLQVTRSVIDWVCMG